MCFCIYVHICIYIGICMNVYVYMYVCICIYTYVSMLNYLLKVNMFLERSVAVLSLAKFLFIVSSLDIITFLFIYVYKNCPWWTRAASVEGSQCFKLCLIDYFSSFSWLFCLYTCLKPFIYSGFFSPGRNLWRALFTEGAKMR